MATPKTEKRLFIPFEKWNADLLFLHLGLRPVPADNRLDALIRLEGTITDEEVALLDRLRRKLLFWVTNWSEEDLKMKFIGPMMNFIEFETDRYTSFYNAKLPKTAITPTIEAGGVVDCVIAKGWQRPQTPYFFLQEYKKQRSGESDPLAQLLAAMVVARAHNGAPDAPMYGVYVIGRLWFFVVLSGDTYMESRAFDATQDDIYDLVRVLRNARKLIDSMA